MVEIREAIATRLHLDIEHEVTGMTGLTSCLSDQPFRIGLGAITITPTRGSPGEAFLVRERIPHLAHDNLHYLIEAVLAGEVDCVVGNVRLLRCVKRTEHAQQLSISEKRLLKNHTGIALEPGGRPKESIHRVLLALLKAGQGLGWRGIVGTPAAMGFRPPVSWLSGPDHCPRSSCQARTRRRLHPRLHLPDAC